MTSVKNQRLIAGFIDGSFGNADAVGGIGQEKNTEIFDGHLQALLTIRQQTFAAGPEVSSHNSVKLDGANAQAVVSYKIMVDLADISVQRAEKRIVLKNLIVKVPRVRV